LLSFELEFLPQASILNKLNVCCLGRSLSKLEHLLVTTFYKYCTE
jgi:hypothetical protein